eukprot:45416-Eustigmatos_ZCMA.PRE.1
MFPLRTTRYFIKSCSVPAMPKGRDASPRRTAIARHTSRSLLQERPLGSEHYALSGIAIRLRI